MFFLPRSQSVGEVVGGVVAAAAAVATAQTAPAKASRP